MMKENEQMSIGHNKKFVGSRNYLPIFKSVFQRIGKILLFVFVLLFLNVGAKSPANSESALNNAEAIESMVAKVEYEKYVKMYQEIYEQSVIQQIEFESEIVIPNYFEFKYVEYTYETSQQLGISPRIAFRLIFKESSFQDDVKSGPGAHGLMQLMPNTRELYRGKLQIDTLNLDRNQEDILMGLTYVKDLQDYWRERGNSEKNLLKLSLAAYNAGPVAVRKYKGVPPYKETIDFVKFITKSHSNPVFYANIVKKNEKLTTS